MIAKAERIETVVTIISVVADRFDTLAFSIEALVPDFTTPDRNIPTKFIKWGKGQGNAPAIGAEGMAVLIPTAVQKRHVDSGKYPNSDITGMEMAYEVNWAMISFSPLETTAPTRNAYSGSDTPLRGNTAVKTGVPIDALTRYKTDQMGINDREAIRLVISHGQAEGSNLYTSMDDVLDEAFGDGKVADRLNRRFLERLAGDSPLVSAAVESGAEVVDVVPVSPSVEPVEDINNEKDLRDWITGRGYQKDEIIGVLKELGVSKVTEYLSQNGNTAYGLALILHDKLGESQ
jgi:hypothetical protein